MTENTKAVECRDAEVERIAQAIASELYGPPDQQGNSLTRAAMLTGIRRALARHLAQPAVPEGVEAIAVLRRMRSSEFVRLDRATKAEGRANANARIDALDTAIAALSTPQPAAQESAQPMTADSRVPDDWRGSASAYRAGWNDRHACTQPESAQDERGAVAKVPVPTDVMEARAQGRAEALAIILRLDAEEGLDDYTESVPPGPAGEWGTKWDEEKLRELFSADDIAWSLLQEAEGEYWHQLGLREEAERIYARALSTPTGDQNARAVAWEVTTYGERKVFTNLEEAEEACTHYEEHGPCGEPRVVPQPLYTTPPTPPAPVAQAGDGEEISDAQCDAVYQAVQMAGLTRDVKSPERKRQIVRDALARTQENGHDR